MSVLEDEAVAFAQDLIRIPTVNTGDPATIGDGETRAIRYVQQRLEEVGYATGFGESVPGRGNLVARLKGSDPSRGALVAHAHVDVVPVVEGGWTHPPFGGEIHDGFLWGRGALDMKGYAAVLLAVARAFAREGVLPRRDVLFAFFADEEAGGVHGAQWVGRTHPEWLAGATEAVGEVGGFSTVVGGRRAYLAATAEKGTAWVRLTARGRAGHASDPRPDSAVARLAHAVARIADHRFPVQATPATTVFAERVSGLLGARITPEALPDQVGRLGVAGRVAALGLRHTAAPTRLQAGLKLNVVPGEATADLDVRTLPGHADDVLAGLAGPDMEVVVRSTTEPVESPVDSPLLGVLQAAITAEDPEGVVVPYLLPASTDHKNLAALGIAGYGFVPLRTPDDFDVYGLFHAVDERVPVEAQRFSARVTARILRDA